MNIILGAIGANITLGLISSITSTANGVYTLSSNLSKSSLSGADEVRRIIKETDLEVKIRTTQFFLCELSLPSDTPNTILYCIKSIRDSIQEISDELERIHYRMQYNDNLWIGSYIRAYKFYNCKERILISLTNLESRKEELLKCMRMKHALIKDELLKDELNTGSISVNHINIEKMQNGSAYRKSMNDRIEYINKFDGIIDTK